MSQSQTCAEIKMPFIQEPIDITDRQLSRRENMYLDLQK